MLSLCSESESLRRSIFLRLERGDSFLVRFDLGVDLLRKLMRCLICRFCDSRSLLSYSTSFLSGDRFINLSIKIRPRTGKY